MLARPKQLHTLASLLPPHSKALLNAGSAASITIQELDYHGISAIVDDSALRPEVKTELAQRKPLLVANEALRKRELLALFKAFREHNLNHHVVFKGTALAYTCYEHPWQRPRTDTDLFIDKAQRQQFTAVFESLGYELQFASSGEYISYQTTFGKYLIGDATLNIDVHWRINNRQCLANTFSISELEKGSVALAEFDETLKIPSDINSLMIACLHRLGHHNNEERLAWLYDIHLLANRLTETHWADFIENAKRKQLTAICLDGLENSIEYFSTAVPELILKSLKEAQGQPEPSHFLLQRELPRWKLFFHDLIAIPNLSSKVTFLWETAFPKPDYIRIQMNTQSATYGYLKRAVRGLFRFTKTK